MSIDVKEQDLEADLLAGIGQQSCDGTRGMPGHEQFSLQFVIPHRYTPAGGREPKPERGRMGFPLVFGPSSRRNRRICGHRADRTSLLIEHYSSVILITDEE